MRRPGVEVLTLSFLCAFAGGAHASVPCSRLALVRVEGTPSGIVLAQRAIDREWPAPGDSGFVVLQGERSEIAAITMSAVVPGSGQLYAGEKRGLAFAAAEVAGWVGWLLLRDRGRDLRDDAREAAGSPADSASAWSFERWQDATGGDPAFIQSLYSADREAFDETIASDPGYAAGWSSAQAHARFEDLRHQSGRRFEQARFAETTLWVNHLVAALDALRAARLHNLPLRNGLGLKAKGAWRRGGPALTLALERRF